MKDNTLTKKNIPENYNKYAQVTHKTLYYYPDEITLMLSKILPKYEDIKLCSLSTLINAGLNFQRKISYDKINNELNLTKKSTEYYEAMSYMIKNCMYRKPEQKPKRTTLIISEKNQKLLKIIVKQSKLNTASIISVLFLQGAEFTLKTGPKTLQQTLEFKKNKE